MLLQRGVVMKEIKYKGNLCDDINIAARGINFNDVTSNVMVSNVMRSSSNLAVESIIGYILSFVVPSSFEMQCAPNILFKLASIIMVGVSLPAFLTSLMLVRIFRKLEPAEAVVEKEEENEL